MHSIKIHKVKNEIDYNTKYMNIYQAKNNLNWILEHKCINCEQQCTDCYLDYIDKISIEKILLYLQNNKRIIRKVKTL